MWDRESSRIKPRHPSIQAQRAQENTKFRKAIQSMVAELDQDPNRLHEIPQIYQQYQVKRRRLYDIINVFIALGCATRSGFDQLLWQGRSRILATLREEKMRIGIDNNRVSLSRLFEPDNCVGLTSLTTSFLLLFAAVRMETLDLRKVSAFFSRHTGRYKSTLCKLYQISLILGALGITERTDKICEVKLLSPFTQLLVSEEEGNPLSIVNLLNRPKDGTIPLKARLEEFDGDYQ
jgi:hypothetical protein